jgi:predicted DNA-binding protein YlxM (UPF0122 family)
MNNLRTLKEELLEEILTDISGDNDLTLEQIREEVAEIKNIHKAFKTLHDRIEACESMLTRYSVGLQNVYNEFIAFKKNMNNMEKLENLFADLGYNLSEIYKDL